MNERTTGTDSRNIGVLPPFQFSLLTVGSLVGEWDEHSGICYSLTVGDIDLMEWLQAMQGMDVRISITAPRP